VLADAAPAGACGDHQKTTMTKAEKAQLEKAEKSKQATKAAKAQQKDDAAQAKSVAQK
jgi:hypothetical protein